MRARNHVESVDEVVDRLLDDRDFDDDRHRVVGAVRGDPVLSESLRRSISCSAWNWSPQTAIREDQVGSTGLFGAVPLFAGTLLISFIAMCRRRTDRAVGGDLHGGVRRTAHPRLAKPSLEILAGIPTVVYGFFAALTVAPFLRDAGADSVSKSLPESALAAGIGDGHHDHSVRLVALRRRHQRRAASHARRRLRSGRHAVGDDQAGHSSGGPARHRRRPAAGDVRAIGETMIVVMAAGLSANLTANPLEAVTTVTVQIVTLAGRRPGVRQRRTLAAFALGLMLFVVTLVLNIIALRVVRKYREQYD